MANFIDKVTATMKTMTRKLSKRATALAKLSGLRKTTYDEDIEEYKEDIKEIETNSEKEELIDKLDREISALLRGKRSLLEAQKETPDNDDIKFLLRGTNYYLTEFEKLIKDAKKIDVAERKVTHTKVKNFKDDETSQED